MFWLSLRPTSRPRPSSLFRSKSVRRLRRIGRLKRKSRVNLFVRLNQLVMTGQANYAGIRRGLVLGGRGIPDPPRGFRRLVVSCFMTPSATVRTRRLREFFGIEFAVVLFVRTDGQRSSVRTACVRQYGLFVVISTD